MVFVDVRGFTSLSEQLPPMELAARLNRFYALAAQLVFELDGTLDKMVEDQVMAFFGAPLAMDDHAERAVEAALRMQEALQEMSPQNPNEHALRMRVGINSGPVVVGDIGSPQRKDYTAIGDVVNTASRLESEVATAGQVVIGQSTWEQVRSHFDCKPLGELRLKGKEKTVRPYRVEGRSGA